MIAPSVTGIKGWNETLHPRPSTFRKDAVFGRCVRPNAKLFGRMNTIAKFKRVLTALYSGVTQQKPGVQIYSKKCPTKFTSFPIKFHFGRTFVRTMFKLTSGSVFFTYLTTHLYVPEL